MLGRRRRRWANIKPALEQRIGVNGCVRTPIDECALHKPALFNVAN